MIEAHPTGADDERAERLPPLSPRTLSEAQREVYDAITSGPRAADPPVFRAVDDDGRLLGPFNAMLYSPAVGLPLQDLGEALRFRTGFTGREREIAVLTVAAHWRSDYEWYAHERVGRRAGLTDAEADALRRGDDPVLADARERVVHAVAHDLVAHGDLGDALYAEASATLGRAALVELVTLVGHYGALALQMRVFRVGVPAGEPAPRWRERSTP
ncbi:carboxymuconolactone decarboxylase family protein [Thermomonospora umbrina]|uniref:4-carboxymuconolactone decarboxylase n=1 Tax=Thermomonospora umbrina TaxID=111806 RepID=A0A3D9SZ69_9ACTN|nr:carboxymuconolactone decarboxylase family protein [Thermomonospora umbrina]REF01139.1 4-carboxymuconolactone decarboxylase [Thermomonospora umbrina]